MAETGFRGGIVTQRLSMRDRVIVLSGLTAAATLAWAYFLYMSWGMEHMDAGVAMAIMPSMTDWGAIDLLLVLVMWAIMMAAMMLPSIVPMVLVFAILSRQRRAQQLPYVHTSVFVFGYLAVWSGFSLLATLVQWGLLEARLVTPMMVSATPLLGGSLLVIAGVFQLTPLKHACLRKCASPLGFLLTEWRDGTLGAWIMGFRHGAYCVGCCWLLMALLFVFGVMNVLWVATLSICVVLEKMLPQVRWLPFVEGLLLVGWGIAVATAA
jgi:predicted metal-binding membrane protein